MKWFSLTRHFPYVLVLALLVTSCMTEAEQRYDAGNELHQQGRLEEAVAKFDEAIQLDSQYAVAYLKRGNAYADLGDLDRALQDYDEPLKLNPRYARA